MTNIIQAPIDLKQGYFFGFILKEKPCLLLGPFIKLFLKMKSPYLIVAYYHFTDLENPHFWVKEHKRFFRNKDLTGRIYISKEGVNGQMSGSYEDATNFMEWLKSKKEFDGIVYKVDPSDKNIFYKMTVKERQQLVAFDHEVDLKKRGPHLSPEEWDQTLENEDVHIIDVRNDYEMKIGHFENAELPECSNFREFVDYTEKKLLPKKEELKDKKILMYCTGGIRCEYYSAYLKDEGFDQVYQLEGGVLNYNHKRGKGHWKGKLFVFDDRLAAKVGESEECISKCHHCEKPSDTYYNCANMDCNDLFISCKKCLESTKGCCQSSCMTAPRTRPYEEVGSTPFRKWYHYSESKEVIAN